METERKLHRWKKTWKNYSRILEIIDVADNPNRDIRPEISKSEVITAIKFRKMASC